MGDLVIGDNVYEMKFGFSCKNCDLRISDSPMYREFCLAHEIFEFGYCRTYPEVFFKLDVKRTRKKKIKSILKR